MSKGGGKSERSERRDKNSLSLDQQLDSTPLLSLASSVSDQSNKVEIDSGFTPTSNRFELVGTLLGFLVWQSENNIKYLEPDISLYKQDG